MSQNYALTWDLDALFPNGSSSEQFAAYIQQTRGDIALFASKVQELSNGATADQWVDVFAAQQNIAARNKQAMGFTSCLTSQDVKDHKAKMLQSEMQQLSAAFQASLTQLDKQILDTSDSDWQALLQDERLAPIQFPLNERRRRATHKLPSDQEALITDLSVDGYHSWMSLYSTLIGRMTIEVEKDGQPAALSVGQAANLMGHEDRAVRAGVFAKWEAAFADQSELFAATLNHLSGFRVQMYKHRGWESVLQDPLDYNRMSAETLNTMWDVIERNKAPFEAYLKRKAELLGVEKLSWYDLHASVGEATGKMSYDEGAAFIIEQFGKFNPTLASFAERAFAERWIEAEDRPGKRPGGFCTSFPEQQQSRIFMTYDGSPSTISTLAH
ncbi:MAG: M3 family metallopeptidase, partial [Tumebacillaceae bacterium]